MGSKSSIRIAIAGATGRMGRELLSALTATELDLQLTAVSTRPENNNLGRDIGVLLGGAELGIELTTELQPQLFDVLIDFTLPEYSLRNCQLCAQHGKAIVVGTTGFQANQLEQIESYAAEIPILLAPNMSVGVNLLFYLLQEVTAVVGEQADVEIQETHHRNKLDAPSGTALKMGEVIAEVLGRDLEKVAVHGRQGVGSIRNSETIGFSSIRAGDVIGDHTALFALAGERLEISHKASSRSIYAQGALRAANWLATKNSGLYDMQDVLGLRKN